MPYRKAELAEMQLDEAVRQYLDHGNYVCAVTLASAAEAIFCSLLKREGIDTSLDALHEAWNASDLPKLDRRTITESLNHVRNQVKHAGDPQYDELDVTQVDAMLMIARAAGMHPHFANARTDELQRFRDWWVVEAETLIDQLPRWDAHPG
jgi:ribosomal protein S15P/S13E